MLNSNYQYIQRIASRGVMALVPILALVAGCAPLGSIRDSDNYASQDTSGELVRISKPAQAESILTFVRSAPGAGRTGLVEMPGEAAPIHVRVGRVYESASGHACRKYHLSGSKEAPSLSSHLACRSADGRWFQSRSLVNPDSLDDSESSALGVNSLSEALSNNSSIPKKKATTYIVVTEQGETSRDTNLLLDQLREAGVSDMLEMNHGFYKGLISLGIYNSRSFAERRRKMLTELGFTTFIKERNTSRN